MRKLWSSYLGQSDNTHFGETPCHFSHLSFCWWGFIINMKNKLKSQVGKRGVLHMKNGIYHQIKLLALDNTYLKILDTYSLSIRYIKVVDVERFDTQK